jgi:hypothetical protein
MNSELQSLLKSFDNTIFGEVGDVEVDGVESPDHIRRPLWDPGEFGTVRAFVSGNPTVRQALFGDLRIFRDVVHQDYNHGRRQR